MAVQNKIDDWGRVIGDKETAIELLWNGLSTDSISFEKNDDTDKFNTLCKINDKEQYMVEILENISTTPQEYHNERIAKWWISEKEIDIKEILLDKCKTKIEIDRVLYELELYEQYNMIPLLTNMLVVVEYFRLNNIVWGVGRGSSVASYCLYLIGVHKIDSIKYDLDIHEFLK